MNAATNPSDSILSEVTDEEQLSEESAQAQVDQFINYYEIHTEDLPKELKMAHVYCINHMKRAIRNGRLEIEIVDGVIVLRQNLKRPPAGMKGSQLVYKEVGVTPKRAVDDDANKGVRLSQFLGALTTEGETLISKLSGPDMSLAESLHSVFLQI